LKFLFNCKKQAKLVQTAGEAISDNRCGGIFSDCIITNFLPIPRVKYFWKSVNIWWS